MAGFLLPSWYQTEIPTKAGLNDASLVMGCTIPVAILTFIKISLQTRSVYDRRRTFTSFVIMCWALWIASVALMIHSYLYLAGITPASFWVFFFMLVLWVIEMQTILQIIINRVALLTTNPTQVRRIRIGVICITGAINISAFPIWLPARLQVSDRWETINEWWDHSEKILYAIVDVALNLWFMYNVRTKLVQMGLTKYRKLLHANAAMACLSVIMDVLVIVALQLPSGVVYAQFHPLQFLVKLFIELFMADFIAKIVKEQNRMNTINQHNTHNGDIGHQRHHHHHRRERYYHFQRRPNHLPRFDDDPSDPNNDGAQYSYDYTNSMSNSRNQNTSTFTNMSRNTGGTATSTTGGMTVHDMEEVERANPDAGEDSFSQALAVFAGAGAGHHMGRKNMILAGAGRNEQGIVRSGDGVVVVSGVGSGGGGGFGERGMRSAPEITGGGIRIDREVVVTMESDVLAAGGSVAGSSGSGDVGGRGLDVEKEGIDEMDRAEKGLGNGGTGTPRILVSTHSVTNSDRTVDEVDEKVDGDERPLATSDGTPVVVSMSEESSTDEDKPKHKHVEDSGAEKGPP